MDHSASQDSRQQARRPALVLAGIAFFITSGLVSWATPDGNLVVTLVPALAVSLVAYGAALWGFRRARAR